VDSGKIYSHLNDHGFHVVLLNPYHTEKFREALAKKAKTDDIDALVIAQLLKNGQSQGSPKNSSNPSGNSPNSATN